ncbi:tetratricopeptide repeat protein [Streptomyces sp. SA15]|uniref:tetratricopeptide repeat protein n=1 Tax=Streptomyces sp. SA15 TaxID=934019 RepID=UPI000D199116
MARAYHRAGRPEESRHTLSKVLELRTQVLGPGHPHTQATAVELYGQSHELG